MSETIPPPLIPVALLILLGILSVGGLLIDLIHHNAPRRGKWQSLRPADEFHDRRRQLRNGGRVLRARLDRARTERARTERARTERVRRR